MLKYIRFTIYELYAKLRPTPKPESLGSFIHSITTLECAKMTFWELLELYRFYRANHDFPSDNIPFHETRIFKLTKEKLDLLENEESLDLNTQDLIN